MGASRRGQHRSARGQVLVIFALASTVLFVTVGLSVDAGTGYLASDAAERAAAAGALSGVPYMPTDTAGASGAAFEEAAKNGFKNNDNSGGRNVRVVPSPVPGFPYRYTVTVSQNVQTTFLQILGFGSHTVSRSATAEYLRPISLGQPGTQQGSALNELGTNGNYYFMREEGWGVPRSQGDAFTPNQAGCGAGCNAVPPDVHVVSATDGTENQYAPLPDNGGYGYLIYIPPLVKADVLIYNPLFAPDKAPPVGLGYHESDSNFPAGGGIGDATQYSAMRYTVFTVNNVFQHTADVELSREIFSPIDANGLTNGSPSYKYFTPAGGAPGYVETTQASTSSGPGAYHQWVSATNWTPPAADPPGLFSKTTLSAATQPLDGGPSGRYYRLRVDSLDWKGATPVGAGGSTAHKGYAVKLGNFSTDCTTGTLPISQQCTLSGLHEVCIFTPISNPNPVSASFDVPLFGIGSEYAGKTIQVSIFDPGDVSGTASLRIMQPLGAGYTPAAVTAVDGIDDYGPQLGAGPPYTAVTPIIAGTASVVTNNGSNLFNGHWVVFQLQVPANFSSTSYWNLEYTVGPNTTATDTVTVQAGFNGAPVHLLP